ncbi:MAG TPA: hypothetical protein VF624_14525 [Tepidisphaeraceae bacterium]|jgi:hypothetical protein
MKKALKQLLNALDKLAEGGHDEVTDTDVREQMHDAVYKTLVEPQADYQLPEEFGMFSPEGNKNVKAILTKFFAHPEFAQAMKLSTPKARLGVFQDVEVESSEGNTYDEYFGYDDSFE